MKELVLFVLLFVSLEYGAARNGSLFKTPQPIMSIRIDRCTSYCNPKYCRIVTVCRPLNRTSKFVSMDIYFHPKVKLQAPVYVNVVANKKFATAYRPHMVDIRTEVCRELSLGTHALFFKVRSNKFPIENLFDPCPLMGHRHTTPIITNIFDLVSPLLPIAPAGQWRFDTIVSVERNGSDEVVVSWNDYYEVKTLTAEEF